MVVVPFQSIQIALLTTMMIVVGTNGAAKSQSISLRSSSRSSSSSSSNSNGGNKIDLVEDTIPSLTTTTIGTNRSIHLASIKDISNQLQLSISKQTRHLQQQEPQESICDMLQESLLGMGYDQNSCACQEEDTVFGVKCNMKNLCLQEPPQDPLSDVDSFSSTGSGSRTTTTVAQGNLRLTILGDISNPVVGIQLEDSICFDYYSNNNNNNDSPTTAFITTICLNDSMFGNDRCTITAGDNEPCSNCFICNKDQGLISFSCFGMPALNECAGDSFQGTPLQFYEGTILQSCPTTASNQQDENDTSMEDLLAERIQRKQDSIQNSRNNNNNNNSNSSSSATSRPFSILSYTVWTLGTIWASMSILLV